MIDIFTLDSSEDFSRLIANRQEKRAPRIKVRQETWKNLALLIRIKMEETIPGNDSGESLVQGQLTHIHDDPRLIWESSLAGFNHLWR